MDEANLSSLLRFLDVQSNPVLLAASVLLATILLAVFYLVRQKKLRDSYPPYDKIPNKILCHMATKKQLRELDGTVDIVIIGSGVGGLATAAILSRFGYKVVVFEQHYTAGGSTHMYTPHGSGGGSDDGKKNNTDFEFDVGVHYVGSQLDSWKSVPRWIFNWLSDGKLEWSKCADVYDVAYNNATGERLEFTGDPKSNRQTLLEKFPHVDPKALDLYYLKCRTARLIGYVDFVMKAFPPFVTRLAWIGYRQLYERYCLGTTLEVMTSCGLPKDIIGAITYSYGDYGTPPSRSPFMMQAFMENHYDGGGFFPKGGSSSIAKTLIAAIQRRGGLVFASAAVERVITQPTRYGSNYEAVGVTVKGINIHVKRAVVSDAGFTKTFDIYDGNTPLVDPVAGAHQLAFVHHKEFQQPSVQPSVAFFYLFVGLDATDDELKLPGQNIWHTKDWDHDKSLNELFGKDSIEEAVDMEPPLIFLSNESAKDPDFNIRHPGKSTVCMIAWTDKRWFDKYTDHHGGDYLAIKSKMTDTLLATLYHHFPLTKGHVIFSDIGSPLTTNKYLGRVAGEIYNLETNQDRFKTLDARLALHPQTTIRNLFMTGQDVLAVSVEGATLSGYFVAARISTMAMLSIVPFALFWVLVLF
mmetsp:Transcript_18535/g.44705  ORF Transcript_18535/g.44705 Transcript_18535/m.44705 type:complete len:638 (-) Transcript_18535:973-2886(-)